MGFLPGYTTCYSNAHSAFYYINNSTGESSWTAPVTEPPTKKQKKESLVAYGSDTEDAEDAGTASRTEDSRWQAPFTSRPLSVFVSGLPRPSASSDDKAVEGQLRAFFQRNESSGALESMRRGKGRGGTATLTFSSVAAADGAIAMSGQPFCGRTLHIRASYRRETFFC